MSNAPKYKSKKEVKKIIKAEKKDKKPIKDLDKELLKISKKGRKVFKKSGKPKKGDVISRQLIQNKKGEVYIKTKRKGKLSTKKSVSSLTRSSFPLHETEGLG